MQRRNNYGSRNYHSKSYLASSQSTKSGVFKQRKNNTNDRRQTKDVMSSNIRENNFDSSIVCGQQQVINTTDSS